jgi:hypothetical protein
MYIAYINKNVFNQGPGPSGPAWLKSPRPRLASFAVNSLDTPNTIVRIIDTNSPSSLAWPVLILLEIEKDCHLASLDRF